jgi:hypothetical protein
MRIGIDISQVQYEATGVGKYVREMVKHIVTLDLTDSVVLFGSSLRNRAALVTFCESIKHIKPSVKTVILPFPQSVLDFLWNTLHIIPISWFTGHIDIFWSSDWTQPPLGGVTGITTIHDLSFLRFPESFNRSILSVQNKRLAWTKHECDHFFCDSEATKKDVETLLKIKPSQLSVIYPGYAPPLVTRNS